MNLALQKSSRSGILLPFPSPRRGQSQRPSTLETPRLSVVIVNYRQWPDTAGLVRQLLEAPCVRQESAEVIVVDNHSPPHPLGAKLRRWPGVSLRRWQQNHGFARAVNEGCRLSRGEWFLLLNPDVTVSPQFLDGVMKLADRLTLEEPRAGIVGLKLFNPDGTRQFSSGPFPTLFSTLTRMLLPRARRKYHLAEPEQRTRVDWVTGCCLLLRKECLRDLGGLDQDFFLYYEDVDLCQRAQSHGWSVWFDPSLSVIHHNPLHARAVPPHLRLFTRHALMTYASKHWPRWQFEALGQIVRAEAWLRERLQASRRDNAGTRLFGQLRSMAGELVNGELDVARRRLNHIVRQQEEALARQPVDRNSVAQSS